MADQPYDLAIIGAGQAGCTLAGKIAQKGVNPTTGEPLKIALFDRGPYFKGKPKPGYGSPERRRMFTMNFCRRYRDNEIHHLRKEVGFSKSSRSPSGTATWVTLRSILPMP